MENRNIDPIIINIPNNLQTLGFFKLISVVLYGNVGLDSWLLLYNDFDSTGAFMGIELVHISTNSL